MSNPGHKKLKDFLNKKEAAREDEFEREALEGFDLLGSEEEALDLKTMLDDRAKELFKEKKSRRPFFWMAAAALVLLIGLSTWFMLSSSPDLTGQQDLAVITKKENADAAPQTEKSFEAKAAEFKPAPSKDENKNPATATTERAPKPTEPAAAPVAVEEQSKQSSGFAVASEPELDKDNAESRTGKSQDTDDENTRNENSEVSVSYHKEKAEPAKPALAQDKLSAFESAPRMESKKEAVRAKKTTGPAASQPEAAATTAPLSDSIENTGCYYTGGKVALNKDLEKKLKEKGVNKPFEALLLLDQKKKVSGEIQFFKPVNFTNKELKEVEKILRSLDKFDGKHSKGNNGYSCIYRVSYKPSN